MLTSTIFYMDKNSLLGVLWGWSVELKHEDTNLQVESKHLRHMLIIFFLKLENHQYPISLANGPKNHVFGHRTILLSLWTQPWSSKSLYLEKQVIHRNSREIGPEMQYLEYVESLQVNILSSILVWVSILFKGKETVCLVTRGMETKQSF